MVELFQETRGLWYVASEREEGGKETGVEGVLGSRKDPEGWQRVCVTWTSSSSWWTSCSAWCEQTM